MRNLMRLPELLMKTFLMCVVAAAFGTPAAAIVVKDTFGSGSGMTPDGASQFIALSDEFDAVAMLYNSAGYVCSGTLISSTAVLTARHCTDGLTATNWTVKFGTNSQGFDDFGVSSKTSMTPGADPGNYFNGTDLAILELSAPVTDIQPMEVFTDTDFVETVALVGFGKHGTGTDGGTQNVDSEKRFATNTYEASDTGENGNRLLYADFDKEDGSEDTLSILGIPSSATGTLFEGMLAGGDSGGPLLFFRDGTWVIGGVATGVIGFDGDASDSDYGDVGVWTGIWSDEALALVTSAGATIYGQTAVVPLPASLFGMLAALGGLGLLRRRA